MNKLLERDLPDYLRSFEKMISTWPNFKNALESLVTIGQTVLLQPNNPEDKPLCIVNTHLISKDGGEHVRMLHILAMLHKAAEFSQSRLPNAQIMLVGDLNSGPQRTADYDDGELFVS